jgi:hypothetical protein
MDATLLGGIGKGDKFTDGTLRQILSFVRNFWHYLYSLGFTFGYCIKIKGLRLWDEPHKP